MRDHYHRYWRDNDPLEGDDPPDELVVDPSMAGASDIRRADRLEAFAPDDRVWIVDDRLRTVPRSLERVAQARKHQLTLKQDNAND